jgi:serine/threonine protein kinase
VAIKVLNHSNEFLGEKFRQEGGLRLDHPHIIRVIETGEINDRPFIVMEYVEGAPLRKLLHGQPVPLDVALSVIGQVLAALEYAHQQQVVHRDIKPGNIMIAPHHGVKLIDFGIAKLLSNVTRTRDGLLLGTPQYMSYEQAYGLTVNPTSDQYAAAIVLYEMLTGHIPFGGDNPLDIVQQHLSYMPVSPRKLNPGIPAHIEQAILRALEKDYHNRFASAAEFAAALRCTPAPPIPDTFVQEALRYIVPTANERANAAALPTRVPATLERDPTTARFLRVSSGSRQGQILHVTAGQVIGRELIDIADGTISRQHFVLDYQDGACVLRNVSAYGTRVNAQQLGYGESCTLSTGALIHVGQTTLIYEERT